MSSNKYTLINKTVSITQNYNYKYSEKPPFNPNKLYPEFQNEDNLIIDEENTAYEATREALYLLGLDKKNYNTNLWNPFKDIIKRGDKVVIKPNAVASNNQKKGESYESVITHGSIIRAIVDYVYLALKGKGRIIIADAPLAHTNFQDWKKKTGMNEIIKYYNNKFGFKLELYDLRQLYVPYSKLGFAPSKCRRKRNRDPLGYILVNLKDKSQFANISQNRIKKFYGSDYNRSETIKHHSDGNHEYLVSKTILDSNVLISIPKLKTHMKVGTTLNIKSMVGIIGNKNSIPHYTLGNKKSKGDQYPDMGYIKNALIEYRTFLINKFLSKKNTIYDIFYFFGNIIYHTIKRIILFTEPLFNNKKSWGIIQSGSWHGNSTAPKMANDLINIALYCNKQGELKDKPQRRFFSLIDGIIGGEAEGPLQPDRKESKTIIAGFNPLAVDLVATKIMGFNPFKMKMYKYALKNKYLNNPRIDNKIKIISRKKELNNMLKTNNKYLNFKKPHGW